MAARETADILAAIRDDAARIARNLRALRRKDLATFRQLNGSFYARYTNLDSEMDSFAALANRERTRVGGAEQGGNDR